MPIYFLLAMQGAGMISDFYGTSEADAYNKMGAQLQQSSIEYNINQTRLESEEQSLMNMKRLRQTLGTQMAVMAARGTSTSAGSAVSFLEESVGDFNTDERIRRLNLLGKENQLRAGKLQSILQSNAKSSELWQGFASRTVNRFPSSYSGWQQYVGGIKEGFGLTSNA